MFHIQKKKIVALLTAAILLFQVALPFGGVSVYAEEGAPVVRDEVATTLTDVKVVNKDANKATVTGKTDVGAKVTVDQKDAQVKEDGSFTLDVDRGEADKKIKVTATLTPKTSTTEEVTIEKKGTQVATTLTDVKVVNKDANKATVTGKTDVGAKVTVDQKDAQVKEDGSFTLDVDRGEADKKIKVTATLTPKTSTTEEVTIEKKEDQALTDAKAKATTEINALTNLTKEEKKEFTDKVDKATTVADVTAIKDAAVAADNAALAALTAAKEQAKKDITALPNLSDEQTKGFIARVDNATDVAAVKAVVVGARDANLTKADDVSKVKEAANLIIESLENLTTENKNKAKQAIKDINDDDVEAAKTAAKKVVEDAKKQDTTDATAALDAAKEDATAKINALPYLSEEEKADYVEQVKEATTVGKVNEVVTAAQNASDAKKPSDDKKPNNGGGAGGYTPNPHAPTTPGTGAITPVPPVKPTTPVVTPGSQPQKVCENLVQIFTPEQLKVTDISKSPYAPGVKTLMMWRGESQDEAAFSDKNTGVVWNVEKFEPSRNLTRAEFLKMLTRSLACNYAKIDTSSNFPDVDATLWYAEYIDYAAANGWIKGYDDGNFGPNNAISRKEILIIIERALGAQGQFNDLLTGMHTENTVENEVYMNDPILRDQVASIVAKVFFPGK